MHAHTLPHQIRLGYDVTRQGERPRHNLRMKGLSKFDLNPCGCVTLFYSILLLLVQFVFDMETELVTRHPNAKEVFLYKYIWLSCKRAIL